MAPYHEHSVKKKKMPQKYKGSAVETVPCQQSGNRKVFMFQKYGEGAPEFRYQSRKEETDYHEIGNKEQIEPRFLMSA